MIESRSKIKADWKLTVFDTDSSIINVYQFPDTFLDAFFDAVNGQACQPMGDWAWYSVKWGHGSDPVDLSSEFLSQITTLPTRFGGRWPELSFGNPRIFSNADTTCYASGLFEYDSDRDVYIKRSGNYDLDDTWVMSNGEFRHRAFFTLRDTELTAPLTEIGAAYDYAYTTYYHLDDDNNPVRTDSKLENQYRLDLKENPYVSTRALILDRDGNPTSISLAPGQTIRVERIVVMEFSIPEDRTYDIPVVYGSGSNQITETVSVTVRMHDPLALDSFIKNAPPGPLMSVWWPQAYNCYNSNGELVRFGSSDDSDWIVAGWDPIQKNWGSMQAHDFNVEYRWDSDPLNFSGTTVSDVKRITVHDIGAVDTPAGIEWNILCHYDFTPPLRPADGASIKLGHRVKRFMSRLPETRLEEYQWHDNK